jgi:branched-chain amino acid transport system substrate-binding protein
VNAVNVARLVARSGDSLRTTRLFASALVAAAIVATGCSESAKPDATPSGSTATVASGAAAAASACKGATSVVECAPKGTMLEPYLPEQAKRATGTPILIGTINQDTGATGAFPELTAADKVAVDFINTELNGIDGHPIELVTCNTNFSPDLSQSCAQEMVSKHVDAVIGGIDVWGTGIQTLENNGIPYVGGIPVSFESARSKVSHQFSGGTWGAALGMGQYAIQKLHAKKLAMIYTDFGPISDSAKFAKTVLERHGADVTLIGVSAVNADMVTALNEAAQSKPDAVLALTADTGCKPTMLTARQIGLQVPVMYTGACAATKILNAVGDAADGSIFNLEADLDPEHPDNMLYQEIAQRYGPKYHYEAQGAGTVSFRAVINLYAQLRDIGAEKLTPASINAAFAKATDAPSFFGHPYTCDGKQLVGYPALCAPQQTLGILRNGAIAQLTDWIDVGKFAA